MSRHLSFTILCCLFCLIARVQELPAISTANKDQFFIPVTSLEKYQLKQVQRDDWMRVYNNLADEAVVQRLNDIRWQAASPKAAVKWYSDNTRLLGEGGQDITAQVSRPQGVDEWNVYGMSKEMKELMESLGIKQEHYCFTFTVGQYAGKIFVAAAGGRSAAEAWALAREGVKATLEAAGRSKEAKQL